MKRPTLMTSNSPLDGYTPGDDPAQAQHDAGMVNLTDAQHKGIGEALATYWKAKKAEMAQVTTDQSRQINDARRRRFEDIQQRLREEEQRNRGARQG